MAPRKSKAARPLRRHDTAPANWQFRAGRPQWKPSPTLRRAGWKGCDLKDGAGAWLREGASRDRATEINDAVAAWRRGEPVPAHVAAVAPDGATEPNGLRAPARRDRLSIGALETAFLSSDEFLAKADRTQADYRHKLARLLDALAGWAAVPGREDAEANARRRADVEAVRDLSIFALQPGEDDGGVTDLLYTAYWALKRAAGDNQAAGVLAVASVWLDWCRRRQSRTIVNWARDVKRATPAGRIKTLTWEEVKALIEVADALGLSSIADAVILALDTGWSQVDVLSLRWSQVRGDRVHLPEGRAKTGRKGGWRLMERLGLARLPVIRSRQQHLEPRPDHVILCERTGRPWKADHFRHVFGDEVRAKAAETVPSLLADDAGLTATFADLRDTAWSWGRQAGLNDDMTAGRHLQSRQTVRTLGDRNYGEIGPEIVDEGSRLMNAWLGEKGFGL